MDTPMEIQVVVATILMDKAKPPIDSRTFNLVLPEGTRVEGAINAIGLPVELVGSVIVNKKRSGRDRLLADGDSLAIIPAISGG